MKKMKYLALTLLMGGVVLTGCKEDFLNNTPASSVSDGFLREHPETIRGIVEGIHNMFYTYSLGGQDYKRGITALGSLMDCIGDDVVMQNVSATSSFFGLYSWQSHRSERADFPYVVWDYLYTIIQHCNYAIDISESALANGATEAELASALGEAHVIRAFCYHYLVQCFGPRYVKGAANDALGVILRDKVAYDAMPRSTVAQTYELIDKDLTTGLKLLAEAPDLKRKNAISYATALGIASRIALTKQEYDKAEQYAKQAIEKTSARLATGGELLDGFSDWSNPEWMWGYHPAEDQEFYYYGFFSSMAYNTTISNYSKAYAVNRDIYDKMGEKDVRRQWWICYDLGGQTPDDANKTRFFRPTAIEFTGMPVKWRVKDPKSSRGDLCVMRLCEIYYNLAEAQARQGKDAEAAATLNTLMVTRDPDYRTTLKGTELIEEVMRNKRIDLWMEGLRFFDMKRLGIVPNRFAAKNFELLRNMDADPAMKARILKAMGIRNGVSPFNYKNLTKYHTDPVYIEDIATTVDDIRWQFMIPRSEVISSHDLVVQNPM